MTTNILINHMKVCSHPLAVIADVETRWKWMNDGNALLLDTEDGLTMYFWLCPRPLSTHTLGSIAEILKTNSEKSFPNMINKAWHH